MYSSTELDAPNSTSLLIKSIDIELSEIFDSVKKQDVTLFVINEYIKLAMHAK